MNDVDEDELKKDIYDVMRKHFNGFDDISHAVAKDFSLRELETFISEYYHYLLK